LTIAGIALVAVCAGVFGLRARKPQQPSARAADVAPAQAERKPFRSAVVELTFRSRSVQDGEEFLSAIGHRIEYIDVASGRRREDYDRTITAMRDLMLQGTVSKLVSAKEISLDGNPGIEMEIENTNFHLRARYYMVNGKVFALQSSAPSDLPFATDTDRIFDSLRLLR